MIELRAFPKGKAPIRFLLHLDAEEGREMEIEKVVKKLYERKYFEGE